MDFIVRGKCAYDCPQIDFIEFSTPENEIICCDWATSDATQEGEVVLFRLSNVYFDGDPAEGQINHIKEADVSAIQVYIPDQDLTGVDPDTAFQLQKLVVEDGSESIVFRFNGRVKTLLEYPQK